ncbi:Rhodanese-related sulfurtransferase [Phaffia rhodozyma]|uniref:Rhodanese-related sulfurtransferase n=1 Tax=Phaffia rhodozyma TaxID=264483 RepID=A0A0F7SRG3_PHARH|nr:Rhodanese-related sulfurtransferase [Phaffia rhodozyma]
MSTPAIAASHQHVIPAVIAPINSARRLYSIEVPRGRHDWADKGPVEFEEVRELSKNPGEVLLLDVRERDEIKQGNIPSSLPLPLSELKDALAMEPDVFQSKYAYKKPEPDQPIVVYCRSGRRSQSALETLQATPIAGHAFTNVRNYTGSWLDWTAKYQPTKNEQDDEEDGW